MMRLVIKGTHCPHLTASIRLVLASLPKTLLIDPQEEHVSTIEWTDLTWNPIVGCHRISAGCDHCYASKMATRLNHVRGPAHYQGVATGGDWTGIINLAPPRIVEAPLGKTKPSIYFVNSMSDMFHEGVQDSWLIRFFEVMNAAKQHTFQVLTKRPSRAVQKTKELGLRWSDNIWAGASIELDKYSIPRSRELLKLPAAIRFVSAEPLLGALPNLPVERLDWIIAGGESGIAKTVRPSDPDWYRDLRDRCRAANTPFFFKQWGTYGEDGIRRSKGENGHMLDGEEIFEMPAVAYDRLSTPDPRWVRVHKETKGRAINGVAAATPDQRFQSATGKYVIGGDHTSDDDEEIVWSMLKGIETTPNPNKAEKLAREREASYLDFYEVRR